MSHSRPRGPLADPGTAELQLGIRTCHLVCFINSRFPRAFARVFCVLGSEAEHVAEGFVDGEHAFRLYTSCGAQSTLVVLEA